jgi:predicted oxidoreductase
VALDRWDGVLDQCLREEVTPLAWSPLAGGRLGDAAPGDASLDALHAKLDAIAAREGATRSAVAIAWLLAHPAGVVPIVGTQQPARLAACLRAFEVRLTRRDWYEIVVASQGEPLP